MIIAQIRSSHAHHREGASFPVCFGDAMKRLAELLLFLVFLFCLPLPCRAAEAVTICVLDSGCALASVPGWNYINDTADLTDAMGHGTKICALLSSCAPGADIIMLKCFDSQESVNSGAVIRALYAAADDYGADIILMSWTLNRASDDLYNAILHAYGKGAILLAPAGNISLSTGLGSTVYPAAWEEVIGVGGVNLDDNGEPEASLWYLAGKAVYVCANAEYNGERGSSFAVPRAAAAVAAVLSQSPGQTRDSVLKKLRDSADDLGKPGYDTIYGWGYIESMN